MQGLRPPSWFKNIDAIIHLAGADISAKRWTKRRKRTVEESRILTARCLVEAVENLPESERPKLFLSASAVGYYGAHRLFPTFVWNTIRQEQTLWDIW